MSNKIIISGPSGVGKNSTIAEFIKIYPEFSFAVPFTTRIRREDEIEGVDYNFISEDEFEAYLLNDDILDWDFTLNNYYGFLKSSFEKKPFLITHSLAKMAIRLRSKIDNITTIFIAPDDYNIIHDRLKRRSFVDDIAQRLAHGVEEERHSRFFDIIIRSSEAKDASKMILEYLQQFK